MKNPSVYSWTKRGIEIVTRIILDVPYISTFDGFSILKSVDYYNFVFRSIKNILPWLVPEFIKYFGYQILRKCPFSNCRGTTPLLTIHYIIVVVVTKDITYTYLSIDRK